MKSVLIVEDAAVIRELAEAVLRAEGYRTLTAKDGKEALSLLSAETPDLVLLDLGLPVLGGRDVLASMRRSERLSGVPVLVLTAMPERDRVREIAALGVSGYLLKSEFSLTDLLARVRACLGGEAGGSARPAPAARGTPDARGRSRSKATTTGAATAPRPAPDADAAGAEALRSLRPLMTRTEVLRSVQGCAELRALSPAASKVLELTRSPGCSMESLARVVAQDHAMALKMLRLANSAAFAVNGEPVDSVQKAVVRIGVEGIRQCVLNLSVIERFSTPLPGGEFSILDAWEHAIAVASLSAELAADAGPRQAEAAFTAGLLHDIGRLIYTEQLGERYVEVVETARRLDLPLERVESRLLLLSHADVMERVLQGWNFARDLINPIVLHHHSPAEIRDAAPRQQAECLRLGLADRLAHALMLGGSGNEALYPTEDFCRALNLDGESLARILSGIRPKIEDLKLAMLAAAATETAPTVAERVRARLPAPLRPVYVSAEPQLDAYRLFFDELAGAPDGGPPNVAVARIAAPREQPQVAAALLGAMEDADAERLPLIVLTPEDKPVPAETLWPVPPVATLTTPTTVGRLIRAVSEAMQAAPRARAA